MGFFRVRRLRFSELLAGLRNSLRSREDLAPLMPVLSALYSPSIAVKISLLKEHPLCRCARDGCSAEVQAGALAAHNLLKSQLTSPITKLLFQALHRFVLNAFATLCSKIRRKLIFKFPVTHRATAEAEGYDRSVASIYYDVEPDVANLMGLILKGGGFVQDENGVFTASDVAAILSVFGPDTTRGGLNFLVRSKFFRARNLYALCPAHKGKLCDPTSASDKVIYSNAEHELGPDALDKHSFMKPAWLLRQLIEHKLTSGAVFDWRVMGVASVRADRQFTVAMRDKEIKVYGAGIAKVVTVTVTFAFNSRARTHPGDSLPRAMFHN